MKLALAVEGSRGDLQPMVALGNLLQREGHEVVVCGSADGREFVEERGLEFRAAGGDVRGYLSECAPAIAKGGLPLAIASDRYFDIALDAQFAALPEATRGVDMILGAGVQLAGQSVADYHGIPYRFVAYCPSMLPSTDFAPMAIPKHDLPRWVNRFLWLAYRGLTRARIGSRLRRFQTKFGLPPIRDHYTHLVSRNPILATDEILAPLGSGCPYPTDQVGYLFHSDPAPIPEKLEDFLAAGPPPVYLGFGSMTDPDPAATTRLMLASVERAGCRAVISRGWAGFGDGPLPSSVFVVDSVNHASLFPRMAGIVHHGGSGTTHTSFRAGVPQLVVPHLLDQFYFGHRVKILGLGPPPVWRNRLSVDRLAAALDQMLDNEVMAERARDLARSNRPPERPLDAIL